MYLKPNPTLNHDIVYEKKVQLMHHSRAGVLFPNSIYRFALLSLSSLKVTTQTLKRPVEYRSTCCDCDKAKWTSADGTYAPGLNLHILTAELFWCLNSQTSFL